MSAPEIVVLRVQNPGFDRLGLQGPPDIPAGTPYPHYMHPIAAVPEKSLAEAWEELVWWESPLQAMQGIEILCHRAFLELNNRLYSETSILVPTRFLYPQALQTQQPERIAVAAQLISSLIRQAREYYAASRALGVTDLSRPVLAFYCALALAQAAATALFGPPEGRGSHGLTRDPGPSIMHPAGATWPTLIRWNESGDFVDFYRACRWDHFYQDRTSHSWWKTAALTAQERKQLAPRFHILECLRCLLSNWGILPSTGFLPPMALRNRHPRERLLLCAQDEQTMFMTATTSLQAPLFQVPLAVLQYQVLYYFSVLARYNPVEWQHLLGMQEDPEGYVFTLASERVIDDFILEVTNLLPHTLSVYYAPPIWCVDRSEIDKYFLCPTDSAPIGQPQPQIPYYFSEEWQG